MVVVVPRSLAREGEVGTPIPGREKFGVCERTGEDGDTGSTASLVGDGRVVFKGLMPSMEFRFGERAGGGGMASSVGLSALGLVPCVLVGLSAARGGMGRPPVVLGLRGMAGSSASVGCGMGGGWCCGGGGANCCFC